MSSSRVLLYDCERDKDIQPGQVILVYEDGKTKRVRESSLYPKEEPSVREAKRPSTVRGRVTGTPQRRTGHTKRTKKGKRLPVYKA